MITRPRRSCLTVPASSAAMLAKAGTLAVDEVVVDLEDGIAVDAKESARENLGLARARGTLAIRINGIATPWWREDLTAGIAANPDVIVVPKVETAEDVGQVIELLPAGIGLELMVETARGLAEIERIAALGGPLEALVFGPGDFGASLGVPVLKIGDGSWDYALARISVAAHAFGLQAIDGPYAALDDEDGLRASARRALGHGFEGKWVVHPKQIDPVRDVFTPSADEIERAQKILAAADGASLVDGAMVDLASKRLAERVIARANG
ncbi:MAG TPA: CoA ester lyase [Gaiellaceae bacterium]|nr:CoA ester lyase [Gaiellaceae bacterium]